MKAINKLLKPFKPYPFLAIPFVLLAIVIIAVLFIVFLSPLGFLEKNLFTPFIDETNWRAFYLIIVIVSLIWVIIDVVAIYLFFKLRKNKNHFLNSIFTRWGTVVTAIVLSLLVMLFGLQAFLDLSNSDPVRKYTGGCVAERYERRYSIDYTLILPADKVELDIDGGIYSMLSSRGDEISRIEKDTCVLPVKARYLKSTQLLLHVEYID